MKKSNIKRFFKGEIYIIITAVLWGFISVFTLPLNDAGFSSAEITFVRSVLAAVFLGAVLLFKDKKLFKVSVRDIPMLMFLGIACFMTVCLLYTISIEENGSSVAVMLMYTSPIWTVVMSRFIFKEKITPYKVVALIGILCGCALLSFGGTVNITVKGLLVGLATGLALALYVVFGKKAGKNYSAETVTFYVFLFSAVAAFFVCRGWYIPAKIAETPISILYLCGLSVFSTALAYMFYSKGLKTVSAGKASMISTLEIVVATLVGLTVFGADVGILGYAGIAVTVLSLIFLELCDKNGVGKRDVKDEGNEQSEKNGQNEKDDNNINGDKTESEQCL